MKLKSLIYFLISILISIFFLWYSIKDVEFSNFKYALFHENPFYILGMVLAIAAFFGLKLLRWQLLLFPMESVSASKLFSPLMVGAAANYLSFPYIGEIVRVYALSNRAELSKSQVLATILLERIFDVLTIVFIIVIAGLFSGEVILPLKQVVLILFILGMSFLTLVIGIVAWTQPFLRLIEKCLCRLDRSLQQKLLFKAENAIKGLHSLLSFQLMNKIVIVSILQWVIMGCIHYLSIAALDITVPYSAAYLIMGLIICGFLLPTLPGQIGLIEFCYVIVLRSYGVSTSYALAAAIIYHVVLYTSVLIVGMLCFRQIFPIKWPFFRKTSE